MRGAESRSPGRSVVPIRAVDAAERPGSTVSRLQKTGVGRFGLARAAQSSQLAREARRQRLATRLAVPFRSGRAATARASRARGRAFERAQLGTAQPRRGEREQHEPVPLGEAGEVWLRPAGGVEQPSELLGRQPAALLAGLGRSIEIEERVGDAVAPAEPAHELAQQDEAPVVARLRRLRSLPARVQVIDDRGLSDDVAPGRFRPLEQVVDRDAVADERAPALLPGSRAGAASRLPPAAARRQAPGEGWTAHRARRGRRRGRRAPARRRQPHLRPKALPLVPSERRDRRRRAYLPERVRSGGRSLRHTSRHRHSGAPAGRPLSAAVRPPLRRRDRADRQERSRSSPS